MEQRQFKYNKPIQVESGAVLRELNITYHTAGKLNDKRNNVIWVFHALTANSDVSEWWSGMFESNCLFDTDKYFIICANILGSCYGTTGPQNINPEDGKLYLHNFPAITIRDMVQCHQLLKDHLKINKAVLGLGGSMGGYQALEWAIMEPGFFGKLALLATSASETAWAIGIHTAQRMAIELDNTWSKSESNDGKNGLKVARAIGMLTYRNYYIFNEQQSDDKPCISDSHKVSSYLKYQGDKLANRFSAYSYHLLTRAMDSHHVGRGRNNLNNVFNVITFPVLVVGITSDILCPNEEQKKLVKYLPNAQYMQIDSKYGHDGFLVETASLLKIISDFL